MCCPSQTRTTIHGTCSDSLAVLLECSCGSSGILHLVSTGRSSKSPSTGVRDVTSRNQPLRVGYHLSREFLRWRVSSVLATLQALLTRCSSCPSPSPIVAQEDRQGNPDSRSVRLRSQSLGAICLGMLTLNQIRSRCLLRRARIHAEETAALQRVRLSTNTITT